MLHQNLLRFVWFIFTLPSFLLHLLHFAKRKAMKSLPTYHHWSTKLFFFLSSQSTDLATTSYSFSKAFKFAKTRALIPLPLREEPLLLIARASSNEFMIGSQNFDKEISSSKKGRNVLSHKSSSMLGPSLTPHSTPPAC